MSFSEFVQEVGRLGRIPKGMGIPKASLLVRSAEGYVHRPDGREVPRNPRLDPDDITAILGESPKPVAFG